MLLGAPRAYYDPDYNGEIGAAYLYSTNGALLAMFSNPDPMAGENFGFSLAAAGSDRVLIGANGYRPGAAHLFSTNGNSLTTITNPTPAYRDYFGNSVAAVGPDRLLVGAFADDTLATDSGSVYVFDTSGTLLTTIANPTPEAYDYFGARIAALGDDRVLINASVDDTGGTNAGSAYIFNVHGTLLHTLTNPAPATGDSFGFRAATFGNEGVIIGAPFDDAGATDAGSVYLFSVPAPPGAPSLTIRRTTTNTVVVSRPSPSTGFVLQQNTNGIRSVNWSNVPAAPSDNGTTKTVIINPPVGNRYYRLRN